ncbi:hypothetical protein CDL12_20718 [Handroanthus impetiginosus]|uniref:Uncharacterized protein n=1 Tax=Handroanthus impetiginosus TaxID=429701 RepID=A0A2G9GN51_9LAMI|nr:hypothetical protein CDL12_20718 [Handroanthus impetiginosus]
MPHIAEMRDEEAQRPQTTSNGSSSSTSSPASLSVKNGSGFVGLFGRGKYKLWVLGAIILLALWSMFTGSVTLKWSAVNLRQSSQDLDPSINGDIDILDVDEREKMVRQMWNVYKHSSIIRLPSFWRDAFGAAYQDLTSEVAGVRNAALLEIAKMSFGSTDIYDSPPVESTAGASKDELGSRNPVKKARKQK